MMYNDDNRYSFADAAAEVGWATLAYDRLGVGLPAHPGGTQVVQAPYEVAQSIAIARKVREGTLDEGILAFDKIIGLGHSYGSALMTLVAVFAPDTFDQILLTGFTGNVTFGALGLAAFDPTIASVAYPERFADLQNDYIITATVSSDQTAFFHHPNYTDAALQVFTDTKGEYTIGQQSALATPGDLDYTGYTNPLLVVTGANDAPFCAANCYVTSLGEGKTQLDTVPLVFTGVAEGDIDTYVLPDTGHGINFHPTAWKAYQRIIDFVNKHSS